MKLSEKFEVFENANRTKDTLPDLFKEIAESFICEGYFLVNDTRRVYICDVEFYYHEEKEGGINDYIMYHRNGQDKKNPTPKYFKVGQLNAHQSGVDITFENESQKYRAGMLVRGFKIVDQYPEKYDDTSAAKYDSRSTYFYEALLNHGNIEEGLKIKWITENNDYKLAVPVFRHNVAEYDENQKKIEHSGINSEENKKCKGTKSKQCMRPWRFKIK